METIYKKIAKILLRVVAVIVSLFYFGGLFIVKDKEYFRLCLFILLEICLPALIITFFYGTIARKFPKIIWVLRIITLFYIFVLTNFIYGNAIGDIRISDKDKTERTIVFINSTRITMDDVLGKNLPKQPDQNLNDSTIAGIDANKNFIRDDVELAIFNKYPNSAKVRAAMLQYAQAIQLELTQVYSKETFVPVLKKGSASFQCLGDAFINKNMSSGEALNFLEGKSAEINSMVINTNLRTDKDKEIYDKYMTTFGSRDENCDIDLSLLPN